MRVAVDVDPSFEDETTKVVEKLIRVTKDESKRLKAETQRLKKENNALKKKMHLNKLLQKSKIKSKDKQIEILKQRYYELQKQLNSKE